MPKNLQDAHKDIEQAVLNIDDSVASILLAKAANASTIKQELMAVIKGVLAEYQHQTPKLNSTNHPITQDSKPQLQFVANIEKPHSQAR